MGTKLEPFDSKITTWEGLWWHPEINAFYSSAISLANLRKFKGNVRLQMRKNKFYNNGENGRPNYCFCLRDANSDVFNTFEVLDEDDDEERLYTRDEVIKVMHGACRDGRNGIDEYDCLIEDYI